MSNAWLQTKASEQQGLAWIDALSEPQEIRRYIRDLVALLTLPTIWKDFTPQQIADGVPPALFSMLGADVIYVSTPGLLDEAVQVIRTSETISPEFYPNVRTTAR